MTTEDAPAPDAPRPARPRPPGARPPARPARSRRQLGLLLAIAFGTLVVVFVLASTLISGEGDAPEGPAPTSAPPSIPVEELGLDEPLPEGDYTAFCASIADTSDAFRDDDQLTALRRALTEVDADALIAVAPAGLQPSLTTIRDDREEVLLALDQIDTVGELTAADLPDGFLRAFAQVGRAVDEECGLVGG